jgi:signal transduction histidine kinase
MPSKPLRMGGCIEVSVAEPANDVRVEVRGYGMGITAENQKIFYNLAADKR